MRSDHDTATEDRGGPAAGDGLVRALGLLDSTLLVIGLVLGSAVFLVTGGPQGVARLLPSPGWLIAGWIAGGIVSFAGALVYAELGAMLPRAGGQYVFLREAYGDLVGFLYGWTLFAVIHTGTLAALAVGYAEYFGYFVPSLGTGHVLFAIPGVGWTVSAGQLNAAFVIVLLSVINYFGVKEGSVFQGIVTVVKIASFAGFMALGLLIGDGSAEHFRPLFGAAAPAAETAAAGAASGAAAAAGATFGGFVLAMVAMLWAYEGWNNITFTAGEIKDPQRNLPRALILGMTAITLIYVGMNLVYIYAMPVGDMPAAARIGEAAAGRLFGPAGATLMSLAVLISVFGCISATVISGPRVFYAMARDGLFFRGIARVHPRHRTPSRAIVWQCVWSCLLCLSGTYNQLFTFVIFAAVLFYALAGASVIVLRRRRPGWTRPYRTWGYPATPLLFVALCLLVLADTLRSQPAESGWGLAILAAGLPAYVFWKRRRDRRGAGRVAGAAVLAFLAAAGLPAGASRVEAAPPRAGAAPETPEAPKAGIHGFHRDALPRQRALEAALLALPDPERLEAHARFLTAEPHVAGTPGGERVARYILERFRAAGLETGTRTYPVYMGSVRSARLDLIEPERAALATPEEPIAEEERGAGEYGRLNWNAYAPSCDVTAEVVFAHHAREEDFADLDRLGIDVRGRIVLARNFRGYRGGKALLAERRGAAAIVLYSDPADDGAARGAVYPDGPWGPDGHIQRGAIAYDFNVPGDPLTPGWASRPGGRRIRPEDSKSLPRIPAIPISARDARVLMRHLGGPEAPAAWRGGLGVPYRVGPGPARARLVIDAAFETRSITNVIGVLRGSDEPERMVLLSNHHDAWVYGAVDPVSGTAAMLELARAAGELARRGLRPRRTLVFGSWDAEEWTLTGSTEWGEENARDLRRNGVVCLNVDAAASGPNFKASAVPTLRRLLTGVLRDVTDPAGRGSVYDAARTERSDDGLLALYTGRADSDLPEVATWALGSGSDYTVFFNHLGIPAIDAEFEGPVGVYHSLYDSHAWMKRFGDPGFLYHAAMVKVWGLLAYRVANADLLPFEESPYPADIEEYLAGLKKESPAISEGASWAGLGEALDEWKRAAAAYDAAAARALAGPPPRAAALAAANRALIRAERDLLDDRGVPGRPWFRHQIYAPLPTYAPDLLPGLSEAARRGDRDAATKAAADLAQRFRARAATLRRATAALGKAVTRRPE
jgi:N-acetylated-alpha-linked acidic dipeptidase